MLHSPPHWPLSQNALQYSRQCSSPSGVQGCPTSPNRMVQATTWSFLEQCVDLLSFLWVMLGSPLLMGNAWIYPPYLLLSLLLEKTARARDYLESPPYGASTTCLGSAWSDPPYYAYPSTAQRKHVIKSLGPLGSDPNVGENKGRSNDILLIGCWDLQG
jgi:hypothetical protein